MKKTLFTFFTAAAVILSGMSCTSGQAGSESDEIINIFKTRYAPDGRVAVFNVSAENNAGTLLLSGETDQAEGYAGLLDSLTQAGIVFVDEVKALPDEQLGDKIYGVANNSVVNIRSRPSHSSELATQALLGMPLKVLKRTGGWYLVQVPDNYISWIDSGGIHLMTEEELNNWKDADKIIYLSAYGFSYEKADRNSAVIGDLAMGNVLRLKGTSGNYYEAEYPDGRTAFVLRSEAKPFEQWRSAVKMTQQSLVDTGKKMMGIPYLWGGTSTKGVDCSGFTKTIYLMNGEIIPRDASQQITAGELIDTDRSFENLQPGDLLFFGTEAADEKPRSVVHVGMWIGNMEFIHSSSRVQINSMDPDAANFDEFNYNRYLESRRYLTENRQNLLEISEMFN